MFHYKVCGLDLRLNLSEKCGEDFGSITFLTDDWNWITLPTGDLGWIALLSGDLMFLPTILRVSFIKHHHGNAWILNEAKFGTAMPSLPLGLQADLNYAFRRYVYIADLYLTRMFMHHG